MISGWRPRTSKRKVVPIHCHRVLRNSDSMNQCGRYRHVRTLLTCFGESNECKIKITCGVEARLLKHIRIVCYRIFSLESSNTEVVSCSEVVGYGNEKHNEYSQCDECQGEYDDSLIGVPHHHDAAAGCALLRAVGV